MPRASNDDDIVFAVYMPPHGADARAGVFLDADEIFLVHLAGGIRTDRLERLTIVSVWPFQVPA
jgi:hypothetical protein